MPEIGKGLPVYPIGVVQRLTGLTARQIRYYEHEGLLSPVRSKGNRRLYTPGDLDRLLTVKALLAEGLNLEGVRVWLEQHPDSPPPSPAEPQAKQAQPTGNRTPGDGRATTDTRGTRAGTRRGPTWSVPTGIDASMEGPPARPRPVPRRHVDRAGRFAALHAGESLTSVFPVNHQGELTRRLQSESGLSSLEHGERGKDH